MIAGVKMGLAVWRAPFFLIAIFARQFRKCAFMACFNLYSEKKRKTPIGTPVLSQRYYNDRQREQADRSCGERA